ncbi:MAG: hypothetical protein SFY80_00850 [Verrucomicrobiota bacterium]|nr:hypothetical protein [Verrucomicrobiota bacterium]
MSKEDYKQRQMDKHRAAREQYEAWIASLSPAEIEQIKKLDPSLLRPSIDYEESHALEVNERTMSSRRGRGDDGDYGSESEEHTSTVVDAADSHPMELPVCEDDVSPPEEDRCQFLRPVVGIILDSANPRLDVQCLCLASGMDDFCGISVKGIATAHGMTRQAVVRYVYELTGRLGLPPSRNAIFDRGRGKRSVA